MLIIDSGKCSGCRRCESHCSFFHSGKTGRMGARIKVEKMESIGMDVPVVCAQCSEQYCTKCPENAISVTARGSVEVSPTLCTLCGACEKLCPIGAIEIYNDIPHVCDLCGGAPRCMEACEMGAILLDPDAKQSVSLKQIKQETKKMAPHQKRYAYAMQESEKIRKKWFLDRRVP
jgi:carbon-monoxide dehydrogenase iron sulfur subunit